MLGKLKKIIIELLMKLPSKYSSWFVLLTQIDERGLFDLLPDVGVVLENGDRLRIGDIKDQAWNEIKSLVPSEHNLSQMIAYLELLKDVSDIDQSRDPGLLQFLENIRETLYKCP